MARGGDEKRVDRTVRRYRILRKVEEGPAGSVWLAEDSLLRRKVTLGLFPENSVAAPLARERFLREARAVCSLSHSGIATVLDAGEEDGVLFVASERIEGRTLKDLLEKRCLPPEEVVRFAREAAEALAHAHASGVRHGDLTSRNIVIDADGRLKVVGFGLAFAPETNAHERSDLDGLAAVLSEMVEGSRRRIRGLEDVARKAIEEDPGERYSSVADLAADLRRLEGMTKKLVRRRAPVPLRRLRRLGVRPVLAAAFIALALVMTFVVRRALGPAEVRYGSVAVLPLVDASDDPEGSLWANGISEAISTKLAGIEGLRVSPWVSSQNYATSRFPLGVICGELNVEALVTGQFQLLGETISGSVALVAGEGEEEVWSHQFLEPISDVFRVQGRIAAGIAGALRGELAGKEREELERAVSESVEAYRYYLWGSAKLHEESEAATREALVDFERALEIDPNLAAAHVGMGVAYRDRYFYGWGGEELLEIAAAHHERALMLDPGNARAIRGRNHVFYMQGRNRELLEYARDAGDNVELELLAARAEAYVEGGLGSVAVPIFRQVLELDPANYGALWLLVLSLAWSGQFNEALRAGDEFFVRFGEEYEIHIWMGTSRESLGDVDAARAHYERAYDLCPPDNYRGALFLATFLSSTEEEERAQAIMRPHAERARRSLEAGASEWAYLATVFEFGDARVTQASVEKLLERNSENILAMYETAQACARTARYESAARLLRRCLELGIAPEEVLWLRVGAHGMGDMFERPEWADLRREWTETVARMKSEYGSGGVRPRLP